MYPASSVRCRVLSLLLAGLLAGTAAAESNWSFDLSGRIRYDDNIGFAPDKESRRDDFSTRLSGTVSWLPVADAVNTLSLSLTPFYEGVNNLEDLSNYGGILGASYRRQLNENFTAPWIFMKVEGTLLEFKDSEIRDGYKVEGELALGKSFNPKFGGSLGYRYQKRVATNDFPEGIIPGARSNEVFDQQRDGPFLKLDFTPLPQTTLFGEYMYLDGDVAATGDEGNFQNGELFPSARDFAFEEGARFVAWKIPAKQNVYSIGWTQVLNENMRIEFTGNYLDAKSNSGNDYDNWIVTGELILNF